MKQVYAILLALLLSASATMGQIRIFEIYGGGGTLGNGYKNDYIMLANYGATSVSVDGYSIQYSVANGGATQVWSKTDLSGTIRPGLYYLIQQAAGTGGSLDLPTPDATGTINVGTAAGKVALFSNQTVFTGIDPQGAGGFVDLVGFGTTANAFRVARGPAGSNSNAIGRSNTVQPTDNNATDFSTRAPSPKNAANSLPVTYVDFRAVYRSGQVAVTWATSYEQDNAYFGVERSPDALTFTELSRVPGKGMSDVRQNYAFTDETPAPGWNYYRLKQVDTDGTTAYSRPVAVLNEGSMDTELALYPNPATAEVTIRLKNAVQSASLIDGLGMRRSLPVSNGIANVGNLISGLYLIEVQTATGQILRQRLVKE